MIKSLKVKLTLIIAALIVVLLVIEGVVTIKQAESRYEGLLNKNYNVQTEYYASVIDRWLSDATNTVAGADTVISALKDENSDAVLSRSLTGTLEELNAANEMSYDVYVQFDDGLFLSGSGWVPDDDYDGRTRDWYKDAFAEAGEYVFSDPYVDADSGELVVTISKSFDYGKRKGVIAYDVLIGSLLTGIDSLASDEDGGYIFVATGDGSMIYHPNDDFESTPEKIMTVNDLGIDYVTASSSDDADAIEDYDGEDKYVTARNLEKTDWVIYFVSPASNFDDIVNSLKRYIIIVIVLCLIAAVVVAIVAGSIIAAPITDASRKIKNLSDGVKSGKADLSADITTGAKDEIGHLVHAVNELKNAMAGIIEDVNGASDQLVENVENLKAAAGRTSDNVNSISNVMEEMSATSKITSESTNQVAKQIADITELTEHVSQNAEEKTAGINESLEKIDRLKDEIKISDEKMLERLNDAIERLRDRIKDTKKVEEIRVMTQGIAEVATQTNLLSLNASIEAARAGEAGRGFAVVAGEIGSLADNSSSMAEDIQKVSEDVLGVVDQLVKAAEELSDIMLKISSENSEEKNSLIEDYIASLNECYKAMSSIANDNKDISSTIQNISEAISDIDRAVDENAQGVLSVAEDTGVLVSASEDVLSGAESIDGISAELKAHVCGFTY